MKYFVTGATGFVGSHVVRQLVEAGHEVVAVVRNPARAETLRSLGVQLHVGDVTDKESMRIPMQGVDGVFHIAGWYKLGAKDDTLGEQINVQGTRNVLELMRELAIPKGVYTSTVGVNGDTHGVLVDETYHYYGAFGSAYERTKWAAHYKVALPMAEAGLPLVILQPSLIYGPGDTSVARTTFLQFLQRKLPLLPRNSAYSWAHVDDIARGHLLAMEKGRVGESYIITGPTHTTIEAMQLAEKITNVPAPRLHVSPLPLKAAAALMSIIERFVQVPETYSSEYLRTSAGLTFIASYAKAQRELGYQPRSLADGLSETLSHEMRLLGLPLPHSLSK